MSKLEIVECAMYQGHRIGAVLLMGGEGIRFGGKLPKQFCLLGGKPVYRHALDSFLATGFFDEIILVCHPAWEERIEQPLPSAVRITTGGKTRQKSSLAGLRAFLQPPHIVAIHDAVRPFVTSTIILDNLHAALVHGAANTCIPSIDTLVFAPEGKWIASIPQRKDFLRGQTPQTFLYDRIIQAHEMAEREGFIDASDDCQLILRQGFPIAIVQGSEKNLKITSENDLATAGQFDNL